MPRQSPLLARAFLLAVLAAVAMLLLMAQTDEQPDPPRPTATPTPTPSPTPAVTPAAVADTPKPNPNAAGQPVEVADPVLLRQINDGLRATKRPRVAAVQVQVTQGVVRLEGVVEDLHERALVEAVARTLPGVRRVDSRLKLAQTYRAPALPDDSRQLGQIAEDEQLRERILHRLARIPGVPVTRLKVEVYYGVVILSGSIPSAELAAQVRHAIEFTPSVRSVVMNLLIEPVTP